MDLLASNNIWLATASSYISLLHTRNLCSRSSFLSSCKPTRGRYCLDNASGCHQKAGPTHKAGLIGSWLSVLWGRMRSEGRAWIRKMKLVQEREWKDVGSAEEKKMDVDIMGGRRFGWSRAEGNKGKEGCVRVQTSVRKYAEGKHVSWIEQKEKWTLKSWKTVSVGNGRK